MHDGLRAVPISATTEIAELQTLLRVPFPDDWQSYWTTPGQYIKMSTDIHPKAGFFVIANAPPAHHLEILIKESSPLTAALRSLPAGSEVRISTPMGKGFPIDASEGKDVLLLAAGSGIAAMRPVVQHLLSRRDSCGTINLVYGERTPQRLAFEADRNAWEVAGIRTHVCLSAAQNDQPLVHAGYVQDVLRSLTPDAANTVGYVCGMEAMLIACREAYAELGGDPASLYTNF